MSKLQVAHAAVLLLGISNTAWGTVALPFDLGIAGMPGCSLLASAELTLPMTNSGGTATLALRLPDTATLLGQSFYNQGFVLDPPANALGAVVSQGAAGIVGGR